MYSTLNMMHTQSANDVSPLALIHSHYIIIILYAILMGNQQRCLIIIIPVVLWIRRITVVVMILDSAFHRAVLCLATRLRIVRMCTATETNEKWN